VPGKAFHIDVETPEEGRNLLDVLANYDQFQFDQRIKPDYANAGGLEVFEGGEWIEWEGDFGEDIGAYELVEGKLVFHDH